MKFDGATRSELLALSRVGPRVLGRLERAGLTSIETLAGKTLDEVVDAIRHTSPAYLPLDCLTWLRSSKARTSLDAVLRFARQRAARRRNGGAGQPDSSSGAVPDS